MGQRLDLVLIKEKWDSFVNDREWKPFHSPKNIAASVSVEASELLELFLWLSPQESHGAMKNPELAAKIEEEVADVFLNLYYLADTLGIDLHKVALKKIEANIEKYPVDKHRGVARKHGS